jgi:hypothetical protein
MSQYIQKYVSFGRAGIGSCRAKPIIATRGASLLKRNALLAYWG